MEVTAKANPLFGAGLLTTPQAHSHRYLKRIPSHGWGGADEHTV